MDYRSYPPSSNSHPRQTIYASRPNVPSGRPKSDNNYTIGFAVPSSSISPSSPPAHSSPEMPRSPPTTAYSPAPVARPKTFAQWVAGARESTMEVLQNGSPSPLVWVTNVELCCRIYTHLYVLGSCRREKYSSQRNCWRRR